MRHKILFAILGITLLCGHVSVMAAGATDVAENEGLASLTLRNEQGQLQTWRPFGTWKEYACYIGEVTSTLTISVKTTAGYIYTGQILAEPDDNWNSDWE